MKIKNVIAAQAELSNDEIEILRKIKSYCNNQCDCFSCIFNKDEYNCHLNKIWARLKKWNVNYDDIK